MRHLALRILDELEAGGCRRGHELRLRRWYQRKLWLVQAAHEQQIVGRRDDDLAAAQIVDTGIAGGDRRGDRDAGVDDEPGARPFVLAHILEQLRVGLQRPLRLDRERFLEHFWIVDGDLLCLIHISEPTRLLTISYS